jgi:hypothetical protein
MRFSQRFMVFGVLAALTLTASFLGSQRAFAQYPPTIGSLTATADQLPAPTGSTVDVTCTVRDTSGSPVAGEPCTFTIVSQPGNDASIGSLSVTRTTNSQGVAVATLNTGSTPGTIAVAVEAQGISWPTRDRRAPFRCRQHKLPLVAGDRPGHGGCRSDHHLGATCHSPPGVEG